MPNACWQSPSPLLPRLHSSGQGLRCARHTTPYGHVDSFAGCVRFGRFRGVSQVWKRTTHLALKVYVSRSAMGVEGSGSGGGRESGCDGLDGWEGRVRVRVQDEDEDNAVLVVRGYMGTCIERRACHDVAVVPLDRPVFVTLR